MSNPTINVNLSSLDAGTVPTVSESVHAKEGEQLDVHVTWPANATNTITCDLNFSGSGNQDPFNGVDGGDTSFALTRPSSSQAGVQSLHIANDASFTADTYDFTLTIDGITYTKDPIIIVDDN